MSEIGSRVLVDARGLKRDHQRGSETVSALRGVNLQIETGQRIALMGPSGCGKSTLLGLLSGLDRPTSGTVVLAGTDLNRCTRSGLAQLRRTTVGYIPQNPSLLPMLTVEENVELPMVLLGLDTDLRRARVHTLLEMVGIGAKRHALPEELSGGQQQRVSVARALAARPRLILADEPAGSLDTATARAVLRLIADSATAAQSALLLVTHEQDEAHYADKIVHMKDGLLANPAVLQ
jgi:putative ABC transport system ATP-binding protein